MTTRRSSSSPSPSDPTNAPPTSSSSSSYEELRLRVDRVTREALELTRVLQGYDDATSSTTSTSTSTSTSNDNAAQNVDLTSTEAEHLRQLLVLVAEVVGLPQDALDLLCAAGYIRQDEWADLWPRMKERQRLAKARREEAFREAKALVLSGEREREDSLGYEGQDPEEFLANVREFYEEVKWHYDKGTFRDLHLADTLRDRSTKPKTLEDLKRSVTYTIPAPTRPAEEQRHYRRAERLLYEIEDAYAGGDHLGRVFEALARGDFLEPGLRYEDPVVAASLEGMEAVGRVYRRLGEVPLAAEVEFAWLETDIDGRGNREGRDPRVVHIDYRAVAEGAGANLEARAEADYVISPRGRVSEIRVGWIDQPGAEFLALYSEALAGLGDDDDDDDA